MATERDEILSIIETALRTAPHLKGKRHLDELGRKVTAEKILEHAERCGVTWSWRPVLGTHGGRRERP